MRRSLSIGKLFLALLIPSTFCVAQTPSPIPDAPPPIPVQANLAKDAPLNPALPTLFIVSDSTARNGANLGWGDHLAQYFDTTRINVANRAVAGRSSRTYYNEGRWDKVLAEMKKGDFVLIQMGHNDGGSNAGNIIDDPKGRGSIHSLGDETATMPIKTPYTTGPLAGQATETIHTFGWYMRKYIADTRAKGATPILLTPTIRNIWTNGQIERDMGFLTFYTQLSKSEQVPLADMASIEAAYLQKLGPEKTAALFPIDHTHTSPEGADINARAVATALRVIHSPVAAYLKQ
jgi:rhamnogalacturonan acetylesterase